jgi:hypothetical protein
MGGFFIRHAPGSRARAARTFAAAMIRRIARPFRPDRLPLMTRPSYRREVVTCCTMPIALSLMESGVTGVIAEKIFEVNNFLLAVFAAAPMFANLTSLLWARVARGRRKVRVINAYQLAILALVVCVALLPISDTGGYLLTGAYVLARCLIAGIVTVRSAVWRANYPRRYRGRITARLAILTIFALLIGSLGAALLLDRDPMSFRVFYPAGALVAAVGVISYSRVRTRRERELLAYERRPTVRPTPHGEGAPIYEYDPKPTSGFFSVLRRDPAFRSYMIWQFVLGASNMMTEAPVLKLAAESSELVRPIAFDSGPLAGRSIAVGFLVAIGLTQVIPMALAIATVAWWGRLLDRLHITRFRARQGWVFVGSQVLTFGAAWLIVGGALGAGLGVLALARIVQGIGRGGGMIAWNLGHNDFASRRMVAVYMGIHLTLTGVRGAIFPFVGMFLYFGWSPIEALGLRVPGFAGIGPPAFLIAAALGLVGAVGYYRLAGRLGHTDIPEEVD